MVVSNRNLLFQGASIFRGKLFVSERVCVCVCVFFFKAKFNPPTRSNSLHESCTSTTQVLEKLTSQHWIHRAGLFRYIYGKEKKNDQMCRQNIYQFHGILLGIFKTEKLKKTEHIFQISSIFRKWKFSPPKNFHHE